jgi:hypothetical protein
MDVLSLSNNLAYEVDKRNTHKAYVFLIFSWGVSGCHILSIPKKTIQSPSVRFAPLWIYVGAWYKGRPGYKIAVEMITMGNFM